MHPADPQPPGGPPPRPGAVSVRCPGCGSVLAAAPGEGDGPAACRRLFEETVRGLREEAGTDPQASRTAALADAVYAAQHPGGQEPDRLRAALAALAGTDPGAAPPVGAPAAWTTTIADVAADLDVIDLRVLVEAWATAVLHDWRAPGLPAAHPVASTQRG